jgi:Zn-dependent peptidase ImmA (M78 family)/DNA-binding XRE family transcriptional regulator
MPSRSPKALIKPEVLKWLRSSAGLSVEETARRVQTKASNIEDWEADRARPSMPQLRKLATVFKRSISDFYLPRPMAEPEIPHDFRRLPADGTYSYSPALRYEIRQAYRRRILAIDLAEELELKLNDFEAFGTVTIGDDPELIGERVRQLLDVNLVDQVKWRDPRVSYNSWRRKIESLDIFVFQITSVEVTQMLGFSFAFKKLPVIAINRKLRPNGRTFTLVHEFAHLLLGEGGICDLEENVLRPPREQAIEVFANHVAGATLLPRGALLSHPLVSGQSSGPQEWSDEVLDSLARNFSVSEEVVLRRLLILGRTTADFYAAKRQEYLARIQKLQKAEQEKVADDFRRNMALEAASNLGYFARLVVDSYNSDAINLSDASKFLGVKAEKVSAVNEYLR